MNATFPSDFPLLSLIAGEEFLSRLSELSHADVLSLVEELAGKGSLPAHAPALAKVDVLKAAVARSSLAQEPADALVSRWRPNPTLDWTELAWEVVAWLNLPPSERPESPRKGRELAVAWRHPLTGEVHVEPATPELLFALEVAAEGLTVEEAAGRAGLRVGLAERLMRRAARRGAVLPPASRLRRELDGWPIPDHAPEAFLVATDFTVQWHITQACDLHCAHCYDRSPRKRVRLEQALYVLDELERFCARRHVGGHVCLTGGNPLLHPDFFAIYEEAAQRGFGLSILGNPCDDEALERLCSIRPPAYYQVSLEGLREHNDAIRGRGHFDRVLVFLDQLRAHGIDSAVMLTVTRHNADEVVPLARLLAGRTDRFTFNRLSLVGEGAALAAIDKLRWQHLVAEWVDLAEEYDHIGFKDDLINVELYRRGKPLFGGCTGYGCGAAFNFIALLSDGTAHACRKFPSPIGNVYEHGLEGVYDGRAARRYRRGPTACDGCKLAHVCRGCMAASYGVVRDVFVDRDPWCTFEGAPPIDRVARPA